ncbi:hypothetical protein [Sphingobium sp. LB126]|uniref:hypothetical protein n=1 Tax=Sphingobium sp. LB126 TaxID=1983755 RepID=UPI0018D4E393|nr:hypothetical protein [Sphingobium sp. LB126]
MTFPEDDFGIVLMNCAFDRSVLFLHRQNGLAIEQIAKRLGIEQKEAANGFPLGLPCSRLIQPDGTLIAGIGGREHLAECGDQFTGHVGLGDIGSAVRQFACTWSHTAEVTRTGMDGHRSRTAAAKARPVIPGHFNIGEYRANVIAASGSPERRPLARLKDAIAASIRMSAAIVLTRGSSSQPARRAARS